MKAKTQIKIGILTAVISAALGVYRGRSFWLPSTIDIVGIFIVVFYLGIYAVYVFSLITKRVLIAKLIYVVWWLSALRAVLFLHLLLQLHQYIEALQIGCEVGLQAVLLWMGINGLKRSILSAAQ